MERQHTHFRAMIFYYFKSGLNQQPIVVADFKLLSVMTRIYVQNFMTGLPNFIGGGPLWKRTPDQDAQLKQQKVSKWLQFRDLSRKIEE